MKNNIKVEELDSFFRLIINKLKEDDIQKVNIDTDNYWVITTDEWNDFDKPIEPAVGSLLDDLGSLRKVVEGEQIMTFVDFERLASVIRFIGEKLNPTPRCAPQRKVTNKRKSC